MEKKILLLVILAMMIMPWITSAVATQSTEYVENNFANVAVSELSFFYGLHGSKRDSID